MITTESTEYRKKKASYPKLMIAENSGVIVLMTTEKANEGTGTIVRPAILYGGKTPTLVIGHYSNTWAMECFSDYTGSVTLTNTKES